MAWGSGILVAVKPLKLKVTSSTEWDKAWKVENPESCSENGSCTLVWLVWLSLGRVILRNCAGDVGCSRSVGANVDTVWEDTDVHVVMIQQEKKECGLQRAESAGDRAQGSHREFQLWQEQPLGGWYEGLKDVEGVRMSMIEGPRKGQVAWLMG